MHNRSGRPLARAWVSGLLALLLAVVGLALHTTGARAAEVSGAVKNIKIVSYQGDGDIHPWETIKLTADWSVPNGTPAGSTFGFSWDAKDLTAVSRTGITLKNPDGAVVATCSNNATSMTCTLTDYVTEHPTNIRGDLYVLVRQTNAEEGQTNPVQVIVDGEVVTVPIVNAPTAPVGSFEGVGNAKDATIRDGAATWYLYIAGGPTGTTKDMTDVAIEDTLGANQTLVRRRSCCSTPPSSTRPATGRSTAT